MTQQRLNNFLIKLLKGYNISAPRSENGRLFVRQIKEVKDIDWSGKIPENTFKQVLLPPRQKLFIYSKKDEKFKKVDNKPKKKALVGINILDLKALLLFDNVFEKDKFYQENRRNVLVIGFSTGIPSDYKKYRVFSIEYEEDVLEHLVFDIFIEKQINGNFIIFTGSRKGQEILEEIGFSNYEHIEFAGPVKEQGPDKKMMEIKEKMEKSRGKKIWKELGRICLACGKCTLHCPTCFCFDMPDSNSSEGPEKLREWTSCFYSDFSRVAGPEKGRYFLNSIEDKIFFWYYHKFVRIPHELSIPGCVSCGRCSRVCPVSINIQKVLSDLYK